MNFTLVGTGNMAWFLASRLPQKGHKCIGVYGRNANAAQELAKELRAPIVESIAVLPEADCCLLAVADSVITEISHLISTTQTVVLHTAGAVPLDALKQEHRGVVWPIYSLLKDNLPTHRNLPVICEYNDEPAKTITEIVAYSLSEIVQPVSWQQRQWLHLCAVVGNNFTNHLMAICEEICRAQDLPFSLMRPIVQQTFERIKHAEPAMLQTGPAIRKDHQTMQQQQQLLSSHPQWQQVYAALSASIEYMYSRDEK